MQEFFDSVLFSIGSMTCTGRQLALLLGLLLLAILLEFAFVRRLLPKFFERSPEKSSNIRKINRIALYILGLGVLIGFVMILDIDQVIFSNPNITFRISTIFLALLILQVARLLDWIVAKVFIHQYYANRDEEKRTQKIYEEKDVERTANRTVQWAVYLFALIMILRAFQIDYTLFSYTLNENQVPFTLSKIFVSIIILLLARLAVWLTTQLVLYGYYRRNEINVGTQFAINQLLKYVVYVIAIIWAMENLGIQMTVIWGGLAALLVGIGLGLQQTFNDFFSGVILLFERSVEVGDVLEVDDMVGTVKKIGMRASLVETRQNMSVIVPNSKLVSQNVINWSHNDDKVRFYIKVGVAYGSDANRVRETLIQTAKQNPYVIDYPPPFVRFIDFADSSLNFELHFWSRNFIVIEDVKSDLRFSINQAFIEEEIKIPFPQRDVWMRKQEDPSE